jgi:S-adenosylmethionine synthetase
VTRFAVVEQSTVDPTELDDEFVQRNGLGNPDVVAELVAGEFLRRYALYALAHLGVVPNAAVDKTMIVGGQVQARYGDITVETNAKVVLIGKITRTVGDVALPIDTLLHDTVQSVFDRTGLAGLLPHTDLVVMNNDRLTEDHEHQIYRPPTAAGIRPAEVSQWRAADSVTVCASAPLTPLEQLVISLERELTGPFRAAQPAVGTDVAVRAFRHADHIDLTVGVPVHATVTDSANAYRDLVATVHADIAEMVGRIGDGSVVSLTVDGFLTAFGSRLDRGAIGSVGGGNGPLGVRSQSRPAGNDVQVGKNPYNHPAALYPELAREALTEIADSGTAAQLTLLSANGAPIAQPSHAYLQVKDHGADALAVLRRHVEQFGSRLPELAQRLALRDPVAELRGENELGAGLAAVLPA